jgi:hypothetical protein
MASRTMPQELKQYVKEAKEALGRHKLHSGFKPEIVREPNSGVELLRARNSAPIHVPFKPPLSGWWSLHLSWTIRPIPRGTPILWNSSFGLNVRGVPFAPGDSTVCLVRYDVDNDRPGPRSAPLGAHLNILQPKPLDDHVHFPVLAEAGRMWSVSEVLDVFLADEFVGDLRARLGP